MVVKRIGLDMAKNTFEIHGVDSGENVVLRRSLDRDQAMEYFALLPPCLVCIEGCGRAHTWVRWLRSLGHEARLMPPHVIAVHRMGGSVTAAKAICDAAASTRTTLPIGLASIIRRVWKHQRMIPIELGTGKHQAN